MGYVVRVLTDESPVATVWSVDGIGAYDHVHRSAMLKKVHSFPGLRGMLPFIRATYLDPTTYMWRDQVGVQHRIVQAEGGEQGDPLMPLLFSLAIYDSLQEVKSLLDPRDVFLACLLGRCLRRLRGPGSGQGRIRLVGRQVVDTSWHSPPHWEDTRVEPSMCVLRQNGRVGTGILEPDGHQSVGDSSGVGGIRAGNREQKVEARSAVVGRHPISPRLASSMADTLAVRRPEVPPHSAHVATIAVRSICTKP